MKLLKKDLEIKLIEAESLLKNLNTRTKNAESERDSLRTENKSLKDILSSIKAILEVQIETETEQEQVELNGYTEKRDIETKQIRFMNALLKKCEAVKSHRGFLND